MERGSEWRTPLSHAQQLYRCAWGSHEWEEWAQIALNSCTELLVTNEMQLTNIQILMATSFVACNKSLFSICMVLMKVHTSQESIDSFWVIGMVEDFTMFSSLYIHFTSEDRFPEIGIMLHSGILQLSIVDGKPTTSKCRQFYHHWQRLHRHPLHVNNSVGVVTPLQIHIGSTWQMWALGRADVFQGSRSATLLGPSSMQWIEGGSRRTTCHQWPMHQPWGIHTPQHN